MTTKQAIKHYGGTLKLANALDIWPSAVSMWGKKPPTNAQRMIRLAVDAGYMRAWKLQSKKSKWERIGTL